MRLVPVRAVPAAKVRAQRARYPHPAPALVRLGLTFCAEADKAPVQVHPRPCQFGNGGRPASCVERQKDEPAHMRRGVAEKLRGFVPCQPPFPHDPGLWQLHLDRVDQKPFAVRVVQGRLQDAQFAAHGAGCPTPVLQVGPAC